MKRRSTQYLGLLARDRGDSPAATIHFQQALAIRTALGLREDAADSLAALAELERDAGRIDTAREQVGRALRLLESVRVDVPGPALRASFFGRKRSLFDLLVDLEAVPSHPNAAAALCSLPSAVAAVPCWTNLLTDVC